MSAPPASPAAGTGRLLVTGATGFIGGKLAREALHRGWAVRVLVRDPAKVTLFGVEPFVGDLVDPESLVGVEHEVDVVVHAAGILGKWGTPESRLREVNVDGTLHLLERFRGSKLRRFVHLSAGGVSGPVAQRAVDESYACRPATAYERTKWQGERQVLLRSTELGLPTVVLRPTFTYGPDDPHKLALYRAIQRGRFVFIGDGESVLHPVFIDDLLEGIFLGLAHARDGEVYIIGGARPVSKNELIGEIARALGARTPRLRLPRPVAWAVATVLEPMGRRLGFEPLLTRSRVMMMADNFGYCIDKARRELGYEPRTELREGIERAVAAYRDAGQLSP